VTFAVAAAALNLLGAKPVLAEFNIQEADIEKGKVEFEYRGAYHWGVPTAIGANQNANDLVQSHELELQYGLTNWWLMQFTLGIDQPLGENLQLTDVEIETEFGVIKREGDGIALSVQGGYQKALNSDVDEIAFGPIVELARGDLLMTLNPLLTDQVGAHRDTDSLGFEYGWRAEYDFTKHWGVGLEMFGQIEDFANAGSFNQQNHSMGPTLFYNVGGSDEGQRREVKKSDDEEEVSGPAATEFSLNVGIQFGLTDAASDAALKFQGSMSF
jgi:hypothetical protein